MFRPTADICVLMLTKQYNIRQLFKYYRDVTLRQLVHGVEQLGKVRNDTVYLRGFVRGHVSCEYVESLLLQVGDDTSVSELHIRTYKNT